MTRQKSVRQTTLLSKLSASFIICAAVFFFDFTASVPSLYAQNKTYHVGSGYVDNVTYFNTLEDLRMTSGGLAAGDKVILYKDDESLTSHLNTNSTGSDIVIMSDDPSKQWTVKPANGYIGIISFSKRTSTGGGTDSPINVRNLILQKFGDEGAVFAYVGNMYIADSEFIDNQKRAVKYTGGDNDAPIAKLGITNTDFIGNYTTEDGGAIWINSRGIPTVGEHVGDSPQTNVTLEVTDGKTMTFRGNYEKVTNTADPTTTGTPNSIFFTVEDEATSRFDVNIITGTNAVMDMQDPFRTETGLYPINITKTGAGTWKLGGVSLLENTGGNDIRIQEGTLELYENAELRTAGMYDTLIVRNGAGTSFSGNNTIETTRITFESGATLTFDMGFYGTNTKTKPLLNLLGTTLKISDTDVLLLNVPDNASRNGEYLLVSGGDNSLQSGSFNVFIVSDDGKGGQIKKQVLDASGKISERLGYALNNMLDPTKLVLAIQDIDNAIVKWNNSTGNNEWSIRGKNWTLPYRNNVRDSFIQGDTAVFDGMSGSQIVNVVRDAQWGDVLIAPIADGGYTFYKDNGIGMHVGGEADWTFTGDKIIDDNVKAALYYTGSGSLRMENNEANDFHGNVIHAGTGTIYVSQSDRFGKGTEFEFWDNGSTDTSKVVFTTDVSDAQTFDRQFTVHAGGNGYITNEEGATLTVTPENGDYAATVYNGKLTFEGTSRESFKITGSDETNAYVEVKSGSFNAKSVTFDGRKNYDSYAVYADDNSNVVLDDVAITGNESSLGQVIARNSDLTVKNSALTRNTTGADTGVIDFGVSTRSSTLTLEASEGKELNFSDNSGAGIYISAESNSSANVIVNAVGTVNTVNPIRGRVADAGVIVIEKTGTGKWNVSGDNSFQNANGSLSLTVSEGTLALQKDAAFTLQNGTVVVKDGGTLLSSGGNKITAKDFTLNTGSTLAFDLEGIDGKEPLNPVLLDVDATVSVSTDNVNVNLVNLALSHLEKDDKRTIKLAQFKNGFVNTNLNNMTLQYNGVDMRLLRENFAELTYNESGNNILAVEITAPHNGLTQWINKSGNNEWNLTAQNWSGTNKAVEDLTGTTQFLDGDAVEFRNGTGTQIITVTKNGVSISNRPLADNNNVNVPGMLVESDTDYIFNGGSINGDGSLVKKGSGNLTFEQSNAFTGSTTIENGKIVAKKTDSLGTEGGVNIKDNGTLNFAITDNNSGDFTQAITGNGTVLKTENGSVILTQKSPNFTGNVDIQNGELGIKDVEGIGSAKISVSRNGTFAFAGAEGIFDKEISGEGKVRVGDSANVELSGTRTYSGGTTIDEGSTLKISQFDNAGTGDITVNGTLDLQFADNQVLEDRNITGNGLIEKNLIGRLKFDAAADFSGTFRLKDGSIRLTNGYGLQNATLDYQGGTVDFGANNAITLGGLAGGTDSNGKRLRIVLENINDEKMTLTVGNNNTYQIYTGELSGSGKFVKIGSGTQTLDGVNFYSGGTLVSGGRLVGTDAGSFGSGLVENNSELEFRIGNGNSQTYSKELAGTGMLIKGGKGSLTLTEKNTYGGGTRVEGGTLNVESLQSLGMNIESETELPLAGTVVINTDAALSVDIDSAMTDDADTVITKNIGGSGTLVKKGTGSLSLSTDTTLTGKIDIQAGTLYLNKNTSAAVDIQDGATLSGLGSSDSLVHFYNGSTHLINSRDTNVLGIFKAKDIKYDSGSTVYIKIGPNGSDRVVAKNTLTFAENGGNVNVVLLNFNFSEDVKTENSIRYEVFESENGQIVLAGKVLQNESGGKTIAANNGNIRFTGQGADILGYEIAATGSKGKGIFVDAILDGVFESDLNSNQIAALSDIGSAPVLDEVFNRTGTARGGLLNELMPMVQTALPYLNNRSITHFNEGAFNRLRFLREPVYQPVFRNENAYLPSPAPLYRGAPAGSKRTLWFQNYGDFMLMQENGSRPEFRINSYGFNVGSDRPITRCSTIGFGMGGNFSNVAINNFGQRADIDSFLIAAYGDWFNEYGWMLSGSTGLVANQCDAKRSVYSLDTQIDSKHNGTSFFASLEGSKKFRFAAFDVSPFVGVDFIWLTEEGYSEKAAFGNPDLPLHIAKNETNSILSTAGLRVGRTFRLLGGNIVSPTAYLAWVHNYNVGEVKTWARFPGQDGFSISGASMYRDRAKVGTNFDMTLNNRLSMYTRFDAELGSHLQDLSIQWGIQLGF